MLPIWTVDLFAINLRSHMRQGDAIRPTCRQVLEYYTYNRKVQIGVIDTNDIVKMLKTFSQQILQHNSFLCLMNLQIIMFLDGWNEECANVPIFSKLIYVHFKYRSRFFVISIKFDCMSDREQTSLTELTPRNPKSTMKYASMASLLCMGMYRENAEAKKNYDKEVG